MLPDNIKDLLKSAIQETYMLKRARLADARFGGNGRYEWETYQAHKRTINAALATIIKIETLAKNQGLSNLIEEFYGKYGSPEKLSEKAKAYGEN